MARLRGWDFLKWMGHTLAGRTAEDVRALERRERELADWQARRSARAAAEQNPKLYEDIDLAIREEQELERQRLERQENRDPVLDRLAQQYGLKAYEDDPDEEICFDLERWNAGHRAAWTGRLGGYQAAVQAAQAEASQAEWAELFADFDAENAKVKQQRQLGQVLNQWLSELPDERPDEQPREIPIEDPDDEDRELVAVAAAEQPADDPDDDPTDLDELARVLKFEQSPDAAHLDWSASLFAESLDAPDTAQEARIQAAAALSYGHELLAAWLEKLATELPDDNNENPDDAESEDPAE